MRITLAISLKTKGIFSTEGGQNGGVFPVYRFFAMFLVSGNPWVSLISVFRLFLVFLASLAYGSNGLPDVNSLTTACAFEEVDTFAMGRWRSCSVFGAQDTAKFTAWGGTGVNAIFFQGAFYLVESWAWHVWDTAIWCFLRIITQVLVTERKDIK